MFVNFTLPILNCNLKQQPIVTATSLFHEPVTVRNDDDASASLLFWP